MKPLFWILVFTLSSFLAAPPIFAGHEFMQGLVDSAKLVDRTECANGTVYQKHERIAPERGRSLSYTIEVIVLSSGDAWYRLTDLDSMNQQEVFFLKAGSYNIENMFSA